MLLTNSTVNNDMKSKRKSNFVDNQFHNTLRLFDVLPNFPITASGTTCDYYL